MFSNKNTSSSLQNTPTIVYLTISAALAALSFPNPIFQKGFPFTMWAAYIGVFFCARRCAESAKLWTSPLWGAFYGALSVTLQNYWLSLYHPLAGIFAAALFALYYAAFFMVLSLAGIAFRRLKHGAFYAAFTQTVLWVGFEWLRTQGFAGYAYGITGYSQWTLTPLVQCARFGGVWAVSFIVILPQTVIAQVFLSEKARLSRYSAFLVLFSLLPAVCALAYGIIHPLSIPKRTIRIALIQPNSNPWKSDLAEFRRELINLEKLSDAALEQKPDIVVWPETAFVPSFYYHSRYRIDADYSALVLEARDYLARKNVPFVIGNNEGRRMREADGSERTASYNAALLFDGGEFKNRYYKTKLVPFAESFPYKNMFPAFYKFLQNHDSHFWDAGTETVVFEAADVKFSTPICFEDTFGYITRDAERNGAELIINLSNDSWSQSESAQWTHLAVASFRAIETGKTLVRATTSGQSCAIWPDGRVYSMAQPFTATFLIVDAPLF